MSGTKTKTKTKTRTRERYWFRCVRRAFKLTQANIAATAGVSNVTVSNYETERAIVDQALANAIHWALITLVHAKIKVYGEERAKCLMDMAKLDFCQYYEDYDTFVIGVWSTETDISTLDEALVWNGVKEGDIV